MGDQNADDIRTVVHQMDEKFITIRTVPYYSTVLHENELWKTSSCVNVSMRTRTQILVVSLLYILHFIWCHSILIICKQCNRWTKCRFNTV